MRKDTMRIHIELDEMRIERFADYVEKLKRHLEDFDEECSVTIEAELIKEKKNEDNR